jgi:hypothetical protein
VLGTVLVPMLQTEAAVYLGSGVMV